MYGLRSAAAQARTAAAAAAPGRAVAPYPAPVGEPQVIPLEGMRRTIAERMQQSYQQAPHVTFTLDADKNLVNTAGYYLTGWKLDFDGRYVNGAGQPIVPDPTSVSDLQIVNLAGIDYTAPAGWSREDASWATIFRATLADVDDQGKPRPDNERQHAGSIFVLPPRTVGPDRAAAFEKIWREQFDTFDLGDTVAHYRSRLASKLVVHYMGRFFQRKNAGERDPRIYGVLYLVDLGGDKVQPVTATVVVGRAPLSMEMFNENEAFKALSVPLGAFLDSIKPRGGAAPYPAGGYFSPSDFVGNWKQSSSAFGGFYVNAQTGAAAGAAVHSAGGHLNLTADGKYDYAFGFASHNPQFGTTSGAEAHAGTYKLDGDILITEASKPVRHPLKRCAVGIGVRQTPGGPRRLLILVGANSEGVFRAQHLIPNWEYYPGVMDWYMEE